MGLSSAAKRLLRPMGLAPQRSWPFLRLLSRSVDPERTLAALPPGMREIVSWRSENSPPEPDDELYHVWKQIPQGHKWRHYFPIYRDVLEPLRSFVGGRPRRFLEIGIYRGASLELWRRFLPSETVIVGIDIDESCRRFEDPARNVFCRIGSQADPAFLRRVVEEFGPFDAILDDGSHRSPDMIASFGCLFLDGLTESGVYLVEDTHTNCWPGDVEEGKGTFLDFARDLTEVMHLHYRAARHEPQFRLGHAERLASFDVPRLTRELREIRFLDSMVVFYREAGRPVPISEHL